MLLLLVLLLIILLFAGGGWYGGYYGPGPFGFLFAILIIFFILWIFGFIR
jgi:hypothetical protein